MYKNLEKILFSEKFLTWKILGQSEKNWEPESEKNQVRFSTRFESEHRHYLQVSAELVIVKIIVNISI